MEIVSAATLPSRADRLSKVVLALEEEFADILEELCDEIKAELEQGWESGSIKSDSPAEQELEETLAEIEDGKSAMYDAWHSLFNINSKYDLDAPGKVLTEREEGNDLPN